LTGAEVVDEVVGEGGVGNTEFFKKPENALGLGVLEEGFSDEAMYDDDM